MANTYALISKTTLSSAQTNVEFTGLSSFSSIYDDLILHASVRSDNADYSMVLQFNGSSSSLANIRIYGNGSVSTSYTGSDILFYQNRSSSTSSTFSNIQIYIPKFSSGINKSLISAGVNENMGTAQDMSYSAGSWASTNAITSIKLLTGAGNFVTNSSFYLYGIKNS